MRLVCGAAATVLLLGSVACGGRSGSSAGEVSGTPATAPSGAGATLDCPLLVGRIHTCADAFEAAFGDTADGQRAGGGQHFVRAFRAEHNRDELGLPLCSDSWQRRDQRWKERLKACESQIECGPFSACAAPALGDPLPPPG